MGRCKDRLYDALVRKNERVRYEYERYVMENRTEHYENRGKHWKILFQLKWHYQLRKKTEPMLYWDTEKEQKQGRTKKTAEKVLYYENDDVRPSAQELAAKLMPYDVISFDIFDTLLYRKVEKPGDVFHLMSAEMGMSDFAYLRKRAERETREKKEKTAYTREIVLSDIYETLWRDYHIEKRWMDREIELESALLFANPYMHQVYRILCMLSEEWNKKIVFMTDMYLPLDVIRQLAEKNGYDRYDEIILSNEYGLRKGDGTLQKVLSEHYPDKKIVHVGDNRRADVEMTQAAGIDAVYNPNSYFAFREPELENIAGSFYRAVIQTQMNNGLWEKDLHYSHGYRVGGILAAGYCEFINQVAKKRGVDKILFCSRDCDVLYRIYNRFYNKIENAYIQVSRYALFHIAQKRYLYDLEGRYIFRYLRMYRDSKPLFMIFEECGFGYLTDALEQYNLDRYQFPCAVDEKRLHNFIFDNAKTIQNHSAGQIAAAKTYFSEAIGESRHVLVVDIGWAGSSAMALKYFIGEYLPEKNCRVSGALMCSNRNEITKNSIQFSEMESYVNTPFHNMDLTRFIFPGAPRSRSVTIMDKLHMPLEYLFTSTEPSLLSYRLEADGTVGFEYSDKKPPNPDQILSMQDGIMDFVEQYISYAGDFTGRFTIPPYTAFMPLKAAIDHDRYSYEVYKDYMYDAMFPPYGDDAPPAFSELFPPEYKVIAQETKPDQIKKKKILFISPEMIYSGAPRSLLRMCKTAVWLGYGVEVWSAKGGPFTEEFRKIGISVRIVPEEEADSEKCHSWIEECGMAVCNTIMTSRFAEICCQYIPTVWYIREATNIPDFIVNHFEREYLLKKSLDIYCVSEYAKKALEPFTENPVHVVHNCVEDETDLAQDYIPGSGDTVKFVQFGTMEYRKGYDVLLAAYQNMPESYKEKAELYFAGGFINSGTPFCSYLFRQMEGESHVHYLGLIKGEEKKIQTLSGMDVVVVASRDESCSLVALEGTMLSKPLIVTENVGANYMVSDENGMIVKTGDPDSLMRAMMQLIDRKEELKSMGEASRRKYEESAGMEAYMESMRKLFALSQQKSKKSFEAVKKRNRLVFSPEEKECGRRQAECGLTEAFGCDSDVIVSLTSHPKRIAGIDGCIRSLTNQTVKPHKLILWLSKEEFPGKEADLPDELLSIYHDCPYFDIRWTDEDLKPHKKYFYAMQEYPDRPVIVVDDDAVYEERLVERLLCSYRQFPDCVSAMRANLMMFRKDGSLMDYEGWIMDYKLLLDIPSTQLVPTGVGGVLYPPELLPKETFDIFAICDACLFCDDLWLKIMASHAGIKTVIPKKYCKETLLEGSQDAALWRVNVRGDNNDESMKRILKHYDAHIGSSDALLAWLRKDRFAMAEKEEGKG